MDQRKEFIARVGTFLLLLGTFLLVMFVASDLSRNANFFYFISSIPLLLLGWYLKRATAPPPSQGSKRFEGLRKWQQKRREAKAKREAEKKKKEEERNKRLQQGRR